LYIAKGRKLASYFAKVNFRAKILSAENLLSWRNALRSAGKKLVVTNGVFDILHVGHATYLEAARNLGDALLVGITCDAGVRELKGPTRPVNNENDRAMLLGALESVSGVYIFPETTALKFLSAVEPDIYTKGGDYTIDTINQDERRLMEKRGGKIVILPGVEGKSTSALLEKVRLQ
jgi:D-glycero-beta-D-manno-heptose 1-phosphate adenylyltransferase